jgi:peptidoglycan lytic transglycosylase
MLSRYRDAIRARTDPIGRALFRLRLRPNHLTVAGLGVSLLAASAFVAGRTRLAGGLLLLAGLFDFFDGSLARASGQVTAFGAFLDSVIDRYSDLVVLLGIVVLFARMPHARGVFVAMAGLVGSVMVSYTKARAESIGIECNVGVMERPERLICLIAGALFDLLEPALWILAILANVTAIQRILHTRRAVREARLTLGATVLVGIVLAGALVTADPPPRPTPERTWTRAVAALQMGDPEPAVQAFSSEAALTSSIADYARFVLADALERKGDLAAARTAAVAVADYHTDSRLAPAALLQAARLASQTGDETGAQSLLERLIVAYPDAPELPEALYLLGMTLEAQGRPEPAARLYQDLRVLAPASGWAEGAADRLEILTGAGVAVPSLTTAERVDRAERMLRGGVAKTAYDEAELVAQQARDAGLNTRALRVMADAAQRMNRHETAARTLETLATRLPAERRAGLRLEQGKLWVRASQREKALTIFAAVEASGTDAEVAEAIFLKGRTLDELDRLAPAAAAFRTVATRFPAREVAGASLWRLAWLEYLRGDVQAAARTWVRLTEIPGGRAWRQPALYWAGRATEQTGSRESAEALYRRVLADAPRSYYGMLVSRRIAIPLEAPEPGLRLPADPREAVANDPGFLRAELLRRIGLVDFAVQELDDVVLRSVGDPVRLYGLSGAYVQEERYHLALRILRRHFAAAAATGDPTLPRAFWEMLYPLGWKDEITDVAARTALDPYLVAAVIREESSYYPRALSRAGARGLMQLMPETAQPMAGVRGLVMANGDLLEDPRINLELGATFLAGLMREYGDPRLALAAYNAGPKRVRQWWQTRRTSDLEAFVEQIPFDETRHYVKRVMLSWDEYRRIYASPERAEREGDHAPPAQGRRY